MKHATAFTAITNPTVNSYKRLVPGYEAPCYVAWSTSNRSPLVRIPASRGLSTRVEVRSVDPAANPYLALAVLLKAGLDGIKNQYNTSSTTVTVTFMQWTEKSVLAEGIVDLPASLAEAIVELKSDEVIISALGDHINEHFIEAKEIEWDLYRSAVHEWERERYMKMY